MPRLINTKPFMKLRVCLEVLCGCDDASSRKVLAVTFRLLCPGGKSSGLFAHEADEGDKAEIAQCTCIALLYQFALIIVCRATCAVQGS